ncbi:MAG: hypothetical protein KBD78_10860, partial [Oligoflexales bacterium]|nr:hypothetical protein [Oligoflexales bacterium]
MRRKISLDRLVHKLDEIGLSDAEIEKQGATYGANFISESGKSSTYQLLRDTIADPMIWFLFFASSLFFFIGQVQEGVILVIAMLPLLGMDAFLHWRTSNATKSLRSHLSGSIQVNRNGNKEKIATSSLVPGDVVYLEANDYVPADAIFIRCNNIQMDESPLTGESLPIKKTALTQLPQNENTDIDESCWAYAGTKLLSGSGTIKIAYTGIDTAYGEIVDSVTNITQEKTPLQLEIAKITKYLLYAAALFCLILASARLIQGYGIIDAILGAATLAIAAIPEEFPVVFTFFLGVG